MAKFIQSAREAVASYSGVVSNANVDLQHLLGVIIGRGARPEITGRLAQHGYNGLVDLSVQELELEGLTHIQALQVHSALLLADKLARLRMSNKDERTHIRSPEDAVNYLMGLISNLEQEHFVVMFLNTKNVVIKHKVIFIGSLNSSIVHPREIFREAVRLSSASIIISHNHPSGDPTPSREDIHVTKRLSEAGNLMGIEVLDHIIIGENKHISLKEKGYL